MDSDLYFRAARNFTGYKPVFFCLFLLQNKIVFMWGLLFGAHC